MGKRRIGPLKRRAKSLISKEIKKQEREQKRKLTPEEKSDIKNQVLDKMRKTIARVGIVGVIGLSGLTGIGGYALGSSTNKIKGVTNGKEAIEVNLDETDKDVNITSGDKTISSSELFKNQYKVESAEQTLEDEVSEEINSLETSDEILDYVKDIYVEEYNKNNEENITAENLKLYKKAVDIVFYKDVAENGDEIVRYCTEAYAKENGIAIDGDLAMLSAIIEKDDGSKITETVAQNWDGSFSTLYNWYEEVQENEETTLGQVADIVYAGISEYKEDLIDAVTKYKESQIEENTNRQAEENQIESYEEER